MTEREKEGKKELPFLFIERLQSKNMKKFQISRLGAIEITFCCAKEEQKRLRRGSSNSHDHHPVYDLSRPYLPTNTLIWNTYVRRRKKLCAVAFFFEEILASFLLIRYKKNSIKSARHLQIRFPCSSYY